jgi:hypothetical protein
MATIGYITSLSLSPHETGLHTRDGLSENSYFGFSKKKLLPITCVFWFPLQLLSEACLILRRTERAMIKNVYWHSCKVSTTLVRFERILSFFDLLSKNSNIKFHENPSSGSLVVPRRQRDGWTDMTKLIVAFRNFAKEPKNALHEDLCIFQNLAALVCHNWGRTFCLWCTFGRQRMIWTLKYNGQTLSIAGLCVYDISLFVRYRIWSDANLLLRYSYFQCFVRIIRYF